MRKNSFLQLALIVIIGAIVLCGCAESEIPPSSPTPFPVSSGQNEAPPQSLQKESQIPLGAVESASGELVVTFDYEKQSGSASNQFAVWIEDIEGKLVKTLYATRFTAQGGYKNRLDSIPMWVSKSELATMDASEVDAITGATPNPGTLTYKWDMTDTDGNTVPAGKYRFFVDGSLRWKNRIIYSGMVDIGKAPITVQADAEFLFEAGNNQSALSDTSPETAMIGAVAASFIPSNANTTEQEEDAIMATLLYQGHGSLRITTKEGKVIYIDPYAGEGYDLPADLILVTHAHQDHTAIDKISTQNPACETITYKEAIVNGEHKTFSLGFVRIEAVQAGNNPGHDIGKCVGYILTLSDGKTIYASGDTSTTEQMGELAERNLDYAFFCCDGKYNMDIAEAAACANRVGAKYSIPYHMAPGELFSLERAEQFNADNRMIVPAGESFPIE